MTQAPQGRWTSHRLGDWRRTTCSAKQRDIHDSDVLDTSAFDDFFGDESAAENSLGIHDLRNRVQQVESKINSQFTSLATYAQIAQDQVEFAQAEAKAAIERSEQRLTSVIERERADRIESHTGEAPASHGSIAPSSPTASTP
jgi:hypothetical protein